ncbi:gamma-glutamyltransferase family protein [Egicoccus halophilus]|uniref:Gamma-glutamyltranspeptidase n=1 Tax=Egicoccus halophilus TaxID=1670830 RepID=A0A8J3A7H3_9ACTN|nr:gamma-glutamyltransferase family protein [Egicoccus halophilus]GGI03779.1 gamma-glutamyltranspeptidase [Egicoccus halophilus]
MSARWFPNGVVASPHHLASGAGARVLADGGNAVDAAVAANLVLAVVTPYLCGTGGDLLAIVWDGQAHGVTSVGSAPRGADVATVRAAIDAGHGDPTVSMPGTAGMPTFGALAVTVPGAVAGWFDLLERFGSRSFGTVARTAVELAEDGFVVSAHGGGAPERARQRLADQPHWAEHYGRMRARERFVQPDLAATLHRLADDGPDALYRGPLGERIVEVLQQHGSTMTHDDLAGHRVQRGTPIRGGYRDLEVLELPPPTQGVTALTALGVLDRLGERLPDDPALATHLQVEAVRAALGDREQYVADPRHMRVSVDDLLAPARLDAIAAAVDPDRAGGWPPARPSAGGTAYLCAADRDGLLVSLIQSNFVGFGSGVVVPGTGIGLHNRGAHFSLDGDDPNAIGGGKQPMHTLIPALALRGGTPAYVFGTMGGDGQAQIHAQVLGNLVDRGDDPQTAVARPRFVVSVADGSVGLEADADPAVADGLRARGHTVTDMPANAHGAGHAHAIQPVPAGGYAAGSDPRTEGGAIGW